MNVHRALSIRQPYAELILREIKIIEYRSRPTNIRERVYIYASQTPADDPEGFEELGVEPGDLATGVLVGTVEVVDCTGSPGDYEWHLANPERLADQIKPENHPQPAWFYPFGSPKTRSPAPKPKGTLPHPTPSDLNADRSIEEYKRDELKQVLLAYVTRDWMVRADAIRSAAKHLEFARAGRRIQEALRSAITGLIRQERLEYDGDRIRRAM